MKEILFKTAKEEYPASKYQDHLLDMYKLYVEMTDRISQRRSTTNNWFLSVNTIILTAIGVFLSNKFYPHFFALIAIAGITNCVLWRRLIISYKQMNSGKFKVIHEIEEVLPLKIYDAEWEALGRGVDPKLYKPFTHIEKLVPVIFIILYVLMIIVYLIPYINCLFKVTI